MTSFWCRAVGRVGRDQISRHLLEEGDARNRARVARVAGASGKALALGDRRPSLGVAQDHAATSPAQETPMRGSLFPIPGVAVPSRP